MSSSILRRWSALLPEANRVLHAMGDVITEDFLLEAPQGCTHGRDLRNDVDAIAVLVNHAGKAAHLPFDPVQALRA